MNTQCDRLLKHLKAGEMITPLESWTELGIYRLAARVYDLREQGHDIRSQTKWVVNRYGDELRVSQYWYEKPRGRMQV